MQSWDSEATTGAGTAIWEVAELESGTARTLWVACLQNAKAFFSGYEVSRKRCSENFPEI